MYAVKVGREIGVFDTWDECKKQVLKYPGAEYRKVKSYEEGIKYIRGSFGSPNYGYYIDGSYIDRFNGYGYSVVVCDRSIVYQEYGMVPKEFRKSRNIGAEFYASLRVLSLIKSIGSIVDPIIYYDYEGISKFINEWEPRTDIARMYKLKANNLMYSTDANIRFKKVDAHSGDEYNNIADSLAKQGAMLKNREPIISTNSEVFRNVQYEFII